VSTIRIELDGVQELIAALEAVGKDAVAEIGAAVTKTALDVDRDIKKRMQSSPASGRLYRRGKGRNRSRTHRASAPGQPPAIDTGRLINSIMFRQETPLTATVSSNAIYAARLEYGGGDSRGVYIAPRPSWRPAVEKMRPKLAERIERALRDAMQ